MRRTIFKPRYTIKSLLDVLLLSLGLLISLSFGFIKVGIHPLEVFGLIIFIGFVLWWSHLLIRRIIFTPSVFIVERYIWSSKIFAYTEIIDIGISKIKTREGDISFAGMSNSAEAINLFRRLVEQDKIHSDQIENKIVVQETIHFRAIIPSLVISLILWGVFLLFWRNFPYRFSDLGTLLIYIFSFPPIFFPVYYIVYWFTKEKLKNQSKAD